MNALRTLAAIGFLAVSGAPALAAVISGYATASVNERAGPGTNFPAVTVIPAGATVTVYGCLAGASWCDVEWAGNRGWMAGGYLQSEFQARRVALPAYSTQLAIPAITFDIGAYWGAYYTNRPFYAERARWAGWHPGPYHPGPYHPGRHHPSMGKSTAHPGYNPPHPTKHYKKPAATYHKGSVKGGAKVSGPSIKGPKRGAKVVTKKVVTQKSVSKTCVMQNGKRVCS